MPTIIRQDGFEVMIFTNDHRPAHVHVFRAEEEVVLTLVPVGIREDLRMSKRNVRKAIAIVSNNLGLLLRAWREIHSNE